MANFKLVALLVYVWKYIEVDGFINMYIVITSNLNDLTPIQIKQEINLTKKASSPPYSTKKEWLSVFKNGCKKHDNHAPTALLMLLQNDSEKACWRLANCMHHILCM